MPKNSAGRFEPGRGGGGLVHVRFDAREMIRLANRVRGEAGRIDAASRSANLTLATSLQRSIANALEASVEARGREQRPKAASARLSTVIRSERNRQVNAFGYTVGYLDSVAEVAPYYRGLESGTRVHVDRYLAGVFRNRDGAPAVNAKGQGLLRAGGADATFIQTRPYRYDKAQFPGARIKHPIVGYHYFDRGIRRHVSSGGTTTRALAAYVKAFQLAHMDLMARALSTGTTVLPRRSGDSGLGEDNS